MLVSIIVIASVVSIVFSAFECQESNTWVQLPSLPEKTGETASAVIGNDLYVAGEANTKTYKYSFNNSKWTTVADRIYQGNHENAFVLNGEWWLVGGIDEQSYGKVQSKFIHPYIKNIYIHTYTYVYTFI